MRKLSEMQQTIGKFSKKTKIEENNRGDDIIDPLVIFHSKNGVNHCDDGFASAWVLYQAFRRYAPRSKPQFYPGIYGYLIPPKEHVRGRPVYLLDFSYKREDMNDLVWRCRCGDLTIIEHHKTAEAELNRWTEEVNETALCYGVNDHPKISLTFDMNHSGAILTWKHFNGDQEPPELLKIIEDCDLWRWDYDDSKLVQSALRSYPQDFETWDRLMATPIDELANEGRAIRRFIDRKIDEIMPNARRAEVVGMECTIINCPSFILSEVVGNLAEESPEGWACGYTDTATHRVYELRSRGDFDVSDIAKRNGGGGHKLAAGFQIPLAS